MKRIVSALLLTGCFNAPPLPGAPADGPQVVMYPWGTPTSVLTPMGDHDPTLTDDMLELYVTRSSDIYVARRATTDDSFGTPVLVSELSSPEDEATPEITGDGLVIYFSSHRTPGMEDVWTANRPSRSSPWSPPARVAQLSSAGIDEAATPSADGYALVLDSSRDGTHEIYETLHPLPSDPWYVPAVHSELTSSIGAFDPMLSHDRTTIYFDSPVAGDGDLFEAFRSSVYGPFSQPIPIVELNTAFHVEEDPWVSPDGRHIFFASTRDGAEGIYEAVRSDDGLLPF
jgi:hypothetical protein